MITKSLAILLAVVGLMVCAVEASAQPRMGGWRGGGFGGFRARAAGRPFGYGFGPRAFGPRAFGPRAYGGFGPRPYAQRPFGGMGAGPYAPVRPYGPMGGYPPAYGTPNGPTVGGGAAFGGDWRNQQNAVRQAVREGRQVPLGQAIEAVRRRAPGRELDAGLETGPNGRPVYRVRWAGQDGRRQDYLVDAGTGAVLGPQGGGQPWGGP